MLDLKTNAILEYLKSKKIAAHMQHETKQICLVQHIHRKEFPVFIRVFDEQMMLQILIFMPCALATQGLNDTARLLHLLNKELDMPGFGLDENAGAIFYRLTIPFFSKKFDENLLDQFLASIKELCTSLYPAIELTATGSATLEDILKQAEEKRR
jgi:hypothetical protein